ncbi:MAG: hypothetical protein LBF97_05175 [Elusimicrobiota bacterium]|jgi:hypothetical protein|nr:hypothetical protein [Elusimicrobiota bacterium]
MKQSKRISLISLIGLIPCFSLANCKNNGNGNNELLDIHSFEYDRNYGSFPINHTAYIFNDYYVMEFTNEGEENGMGLDFSKTYANFIYFDGIFSHYDAYNMPSNHGLINFRYSFTSSYSSTLNLYFLITSVTVGS